MAEIEQTIVIPRWLADEHVLQHRFRDTRSAAVSDEVCAKFPVTRPTERHVVSQNLYFLSIFLDRCQLVVREGRFFSVLQFDVREFPAADNPLLSLHRKSVPPLHVV